MKKFFDKKTVFSFLIGGIVFGCLSIGAVTIYNSNQVSYGKNNVEKALNELYNNIDVQKTDIIVANYLNEQVTISLSWVPFHPTIYNNSFFDLETNDLIVKKSGEYKIYYQSAFDGGTAGTSNVRILINEVEVGKCGSGYARCDNREIFYTANLNVNDSIRVEVYSSSNSFGARAVVSIVKLMD